MVHCATGREPADAFTGERLTYAEYYATKTRALASPSNALKEGQENSDCSTLADLALHFDLSIVIVDDALND